MGNIHIVGPNKALVISGGCCRGGGKKYIIGGWGCAWWLVTDTQTISLEIMTLNPIVEHVETSDGVPVTVTGVCQVKVFTEPIFLKIACEQFLGKSPQHIESVIVQLIEGHFRAILGTLSLESIHQNRDQFAQLVREVASPDVGKLGIEILGLTIKDVFDHVE